MLSDSEKHSGPIPSASLALVAFALRPELVTEALQIEPNTAEISLVRNCRTNRKEECGLWAYDTTQRISSSDLSEHLEYLLGVFRPLKSRLEEITPRPNLFVHLNCSRAARVQARHIAGIAELGASLMVNVLNPAPSFGGT